MRTRTLGYSDLNLTTVGFGAWAIGGGGYAYGWGPQDDKQSIETIHKALEMGINWIDTAAVYGLGRSERVVAEAVKGQRDKVIIATKCGLKWDKKGEIYGHLKADSIRKELEDSLSRLQTDYIDLYQIHWPNPDKDIEEAWEVVAKAIQDGKVRYGGVSNFDVGQMKRVLKTHRITSLQPPYSMLRRAIEKEIMPFCGEQNIGIICYSPMLNGLLTGKVTKEWIDNLPDEDWRKTKSVEFREPNLSVNIEFVDKLTALAADHGKKPGQLAIAWTLRNPEVTSAIVGARKPSQVVENAAAGDWELDDKTINEVEKLLQERQKALS